MTAPGDVKAALLYFGREVEEELDSEGYDPDDEDFRHELSRRLTERMGGIYQVVAFTRHDHEMKQAMGRDPSDEDDVLAYLRQWAGLGASELAEREWLVYSISADFPNDFGQRPLGLRLRCG